MESIGVTGVPFLQSSYGPAWRRGRRQRRTQALAGFLQERGELLEFKESPSTALRQALDS